MNVHLWFFLIVAVGIPVVWAGVQVRRTWRTRKTFDSVVGRQLAGYLFVAPAYFTFAAIILVPTFSTVVLSFQVPQDEFSSQVQFGYGNYINLFTKDPVVFEAFANNTFYLVATLIVEVLAGLVMALVLAKDRAGFHFFRLLFFSPLMLSMVVVGLLWKFMLRAEGGLANHALSLLGFESLAETSWLSHPTYTLPAICLISGWIYAGFYLILFHAAIHRIPESLLESARIDGCHEWQVSYHVILPLLKDVGLVCILICATGAFKAFDLFYVMSPSGLNRTEMVATYLVKEILDNRNPYYGSAIAVLMTVVVLGISLILTRIQQRSETLEY